MSSRTKIILLVAAITWCCKDLKAEALNVMGNLFMASFNGPPSERVAFALPNSLVNITESEPHWKSMCNSTVKSKFNESMFPQVVYDVQCSEKNDETLCEQSYKRIHMLWKRDCMGNICSYDVVTQQIQTACIPKAPYMEKQSEAYLRKLIKLTGFLNNNTVRNKLDKVLRFFGEEAQNDGLERVDSDEANFFNSCEWNWVANVDENRFPKVFERAVCKNYTLCKPVFKEIVMFAKRNEISCFGNYCNYVPHIYNEPVACILKNSVNRNGISY